MHSSDGMSASLPSSIWFTQSHSIGMYASNCGVAGSYTCFGKCGIAACSREGQGVWITNTFLTMLSYRNWFDSGQGTRKWLRAVVSETNVTSMENKWKKLGKK